MVPKCSDRELGASFHSFDNFFVNNGMVWLHIAIELLYAWLHIISIRISL